MLTLMLAGSLALPAPNGKMASGDAVVRWTPDSIRMETAHVQAAFSTEGGRLLRTQWRDRPPSPLLHWMTGAEPWGDSWKTESPRGEGVGGSFPVYPTPYPLHPEPL